MSQWPHKDVSAEKAAYEKAPQRCEVCGKPIPWLQWTLHHPRACNKICGTELGIRTRMRNRAARVAPQLIFALYLFLLAALQCGCEYLNLIK